MYMYIILVKISYYSYCLILQCVSVQSVLAMIRHFQQLFDVPRLDGVYAAMSRLYQQTEKAKNIFKQLKASLQLGKNNQYY